MQEIVGVLLKKVKEEGFFNLSDFDGSCPCSGFSLYGVTIDVHCWRVCHDCEFSGIHFSTGHNGGDPVHEKDVVLFKPLADEIIRQIRERWEEIEMNVVYSPYSN